MDNNVPQPPQQQPAQQPGQQPQQQPQNQPVPGQQQQQAPPQSGDNPMLNAVLGFGLSDPGIQNGEDMQSLLREIGIQNPQQPGQQQQVPNPSQQQPGQQQPGQQQPPQPGQQQQQPPEEGQQQQQQDQWGNPVGPNPVGQDGKPIPGFQSPILSGMNAPETQEQITSDADLISAVNKKYGLNIQNIQEIPKFFEIADKWRKDSTQFSDVKTEADQYKQLLNDLPSDVFKSIQAYYNGQDWREPLKDINSGLDFTKDATQQDLVKMVNTFDQTGKKWTLEELNDPENTTASYAKQNAIQSFNQKKAAYEQERTTVSDQVRKQQDAYISSVSSSVETLKTSLPLLDQATENQLTEILKGGNLNTLFLNNDGTVKKEAAERLLYALHGKETLEEMRKRAMAEGRTQATQQHVQQMPAQPPMNQGGAPQGQPQLPPELTRAFQGLGKGSPYNE